MSPIQSSSPSTRKELVQLGTVPTKYANPSGQNKLKIVAYSAATTAVSALIYKYVLGF